MDGNTVAVLLGGVIIGLVLGAVGTAVGFLSVFRKHYVVLGSDVQAELAEVLRKREEIDSMVESVMQLDDDERAELALDLGRRLTAQQEATREEAA
jgi:hypothetical protein